MTRNRTVVIAALTVATSLMAAAPAMAANLGSSGGFIYVKATKTAGKSDGFSFAKPAAKCPNGSKPVGGGGSISTTPINSTLSGTYPSVGEKWGAELWNFGLFQKAKVSAYGVCAKKENKVSNVAVPVSANAQGVTGAAPGCQEPGSTITGGGHAVPDLTEYYSHGSYPTDSGGTWVSQLVHRVTEADTWSAFAVCMKGGNPSYPLEQFAAADPAKSKAMCPRGTSVTGGGFFSPKDSGSDASASTSKPVDSKKDKDKVPDDGWAVEMSDPNQNTLIAGAIAACR